MMIEFMFNGVWGRGGAVYPLLVTLLRTPVLLGYHRRQLDETHEMM